MKRKKMIKEKIFLLVAVLFIFIILFSNVYALGISPGRATFNFEPDTEKEVGIKIVKIVNTDNKIMDISLRVEGEWAEYISLNQTSLSFNADERMKSINYRVKFPTSIKRKGIKAKIIASEIISGPTNKGTDIGVNIAVEHQLYVLTNITGLEKKEINITRVFVEHYQKGESAKVEIEIMNPSTKKMENVYATMLIFDKYGMLRSQFNSTHTDIEPNRSSIIAAFWDTYGFEEGDYGGNLIIYHDNKTEEQNLIIYLSTNRIEVDFGKFEFEKPPVEEPLPIREIKKLKPEIIILIIAVIIFIIIDIIIFINLKKKKIRKAKKAKKSKK